MEETGCCNIRSMETCLIVFRLLGVAHEGNTTGCYKALGNDCLADAVLLATTRKLTTSQVKLCGRICFLTRMSIFSVVRQLHSDFRAGLLDNLP